MSGPLVLSYKVAATLSAQRVVAAVSGTAGTVGYPEAATKLPLGITIDDVKDTNQAIPVQFSGRAKLYFNDTVTTGQLVASDTSGRGIPFTPASTSTGLTLPTGVIGVLVGPSVAATGTIAEVHLNPQLKA
jgi:hypothetical protein